MEGAGPFVPDQNRVVGPLATRVEPGPDTVTTPSAAGPPLPMTTDARSPSTSILPPERMLTSLRWSMGPVSESG